jgi:hypothetical protein
LASESGVIDPGLSACAEVGMKPSYVLLTPFSIFSVLAIHKLILD